MRWIFIGLVVMNLAYVGYHFSQTQAVVNDQVVEVTLASGAASIKLLSEVKVRARQAASAQNKEQLCWSVGPYKVELDAKHLSARMLALDIEARIEPQLVVVKKESWVYLPPSSNKKMALRKLRELHKRKIDSFVITEGELANGISLGLFGKQGSVDRLLAKLIKKNIKPKVKFLERKRNQYWVLTPLNKRAPIDSEARQRLLDNPKFQWQKIRCDSGLPQA